MPAPAPIEKPDRPGIGDTVLTKIRGPTASVTRFEVNRPALVEEWPKAVMIEPRYFTEYLVEVENLPVTVESK